MENQNSIPEGAQGAGRTRPRLQFEYDGVDDILTVEGVRYSGDFFRMFATPDPSTLYKISREPGGAVELSVVVGAGEPTV